MEYIHYLCLVFQFCNPPMAAENQNCQEVKQSGGESSGTYINKRGFPKCC